MEGNGGIASDSAPLSPSPGGPAHSMFPGPGLWPSVQHTEGAGYSGRGGANGYGTLGGRGKLPEGSRLPCPYRIEDPTSIP